MQTSPLLLTLSALFVTVLLTSNLIAVKLIALGPMILPAAVIVFPLSYLFGDVLTEVYGYAVTRRVIWLGFGCNLLFVVFILAAVRYRALRAPGTQTPNRRLDASSASRRAC